MSQHVDVTYITSSFFVLIGGPFTQSESKNVLCFLRLSIDLFAYPLIFSLSLAVNCLLVSCFVSKIN